MSIRVSDQLKADLSEAAKELGMAEFEVMRLAMQIGLKHFAAIDYDLASAVISNSGILKNPALTVTSGAQSASIVTIPPGPSSDSGGTKKKA